MVVIALVSRCKSDDPDPTPSVGTAYEWITPKGFPTPNFPANNPMTVEGIDLGRHLFFDKRLSVDGTISCGSCHQPSFYFSDPVAISEGIEGRKGKRNAMPIFNLAWQEFFFWDGRVTNLEEQSLHPIQDPMEMDMDLENLISLLAADSLYQFKFKAAFGDSKVNTSRIGKAIAQFERTIVSSNSEFDRVKRMTGNTDNPFIDNPSSPGDPNKGWEMFSSDSPSNGVRGGSCHHCHGGVSTGFLMASFGLEEQHFSNNGLKEEHSADMGRYEVTGLERDIGKFKVPSVRNMAWTFPYMHDGSIGAIPGSDQILDLIEFYNSGVHINSRNLDGNMKEFDGLVVKNWNAEAMQDLKAFLLTLSDDSIQDNPDYKDPWP